MKKNFILYSLGVLAVASSMCSCNQNLLEIPQKGVIASDEFYITDADAESALTSVYAQAITLISSGTNGINNPSWNVFINACGDEMYWGGGKKNGSSSGAQDMNEFRKTYDNTIGHIKYVYNQLYSLIYKSNLVIDNFYGSDGSLCDTPTKKRCVAEARVFRAWAHFTLATYFGTPPLVDHVLAADARPTNCDHDVLMKWVIDEFKAALPDLEARKGPKDKNGAIKITTGNCLAFLGKAQVFNKDWAGAKESLKKVIDSGNYALVPGSEMHNLFNCAGDCNEEKVLEMNYDYHEKAGSGKYHYQRNNALFFRMMKLPSIFIQPEGWGNNVAPTQVFVDAMMKHEPNSARRKAWFVSFEEFMTDFDYSNQNPQDPTMTKEQKLMDPARGFAPTSSYDELYANYGYFMVKFMPLQADLIPNSTTITDENRFVMRYAEVLLLYAEACAMGGDSDGSGLKALNDVQKRAGAPVTTLTMDNVKQEKWFELAWEGTRFVDLVRWGDAPTVLAWKSKDKTPYFSDEFYVKGTNGKKKSGKPHATRLSWKDDGWGALGGGYKAGKHELYPFPFSVTEKNPWDAEKGVGIKQNPGWE